MNDLGRISARLFDVAWLLVMLATAIFIVAVAIDILWGLGWGFRIFDAIMAGIILGFGLLIRVVGSLILRLVGRSE